jgi:hypothetical protein
LKVDTMDATTFDSRSRNIQSKNTDDDDYFFAAIETRTTKARTSLLKAHSIESPSLVSLFVDPAPQCTDLESDRALHRDGFRERTFSCQINASAIPIPKAPAKCAAEYVECEREEVQNTRHYDASTYMMQDRIIRGRSRLSKSVDAPLPFLVCRIQLAREQARREWDAQMEQEPRPSPVSSAVDCLWEDVFTLDMEEPPTTFPVRRPSAVSSAVDCLWEDVFTFDTD